MKAFFSVLRLRQRAETQYRGAVLGGVVCQIFFGIILIAVYRALYATREQTLAFKDVATYVWLQQAFFRMILGSDSELGEKIGSGAIAYDLCRPLGIYGYYFARDLAVRSVGSLMRAVPMLCFACLLPEGWGISSPASVTALLCAAVSLVLGLLCVCALGGIAHGFTLMTLDNRGIEALMNMLLVTFSGNLLPLTLFPDSWQGVIRLLPYAQLLDAPARIYTGSQPLSGVAGVWLLQTAWIIVLVIAGKLLWKANVKRLVVQGG